MQATLEAPVTTAPHRLLVHYHRADGHYDHWSVYAWGDVAGSHAFPSGAAFTGEDAYGRFAWVDLAPGARTVGFLVVNREGGKDVDGDRFVDPAVTPEIWLRDGDDALQEGPAAAEPGPGVAVIHYRRPAGDYDGWGLHVWEGAAPRTHWHEPLEPSSFDAFGAVFRVAVRLDAIGLRFVVHHGAHKDLHDDQRLDLTVVREVWVVAGDPVPVRPAALRTLGPDLDPARALAHWVDRGTLVLPAHHADLAVSHELLHAPEGGVRLLGGVLVGPCGQVPDLVDADAGPDAITRHPLHARPGGLFQIQRRRFPHLVAGHRTFAVGELHPDVLRGQLLVAGRDHDGRLVSVTGVQIAGVLDDLYADAATAPIGPRIENGRPSLAVWAPTARTVTLELFKDLDHEPRLHEMTRDDETGIWRIDGKRKWLGRWYRFVVEVWHPEAQRVIVSRTTDPYSQGLSVDSTHSRLVDLDDPDLAPEGWATLRKPAAVAPARSQIWEVQVREFSIADATVPAADRGSYLAFTHDSAGMRHLRRLAEAGLTHVHLLPVADFATVPDRREDQAVPAGDLASFRPDSPEQQARIAAVADRDGWNWGYDPLHWNTPEGSYATDPHQRTLEFRQMVAALNAAGLRVVIDVVYNHTMASGLAPFSVLDRIVPGYYHRLLHDGTVAESTCCANTAAENTMMGRLIVDSLLLWRRHYKIDGFRFDLMGHHPRSVIVAARDALGPDVLLYGEGWNFGEVADDHRFAQASQRGMAGTGIATFNDRLRDAVRGGGSHEGNPRRQGFATGLWTDPNGDGVSGDLPHQRTALLRLQDRIRVGLTGNLAGYQFTDHTGALVTGAQIDYHGSPTGYNAAPGECVSYVDAHDNEILYDALAYKLPASTSPLDRARMQVLALSLVVLGQGIGFLAAGSERLRSKSFDRNSYNSGDWFNAIRWNPATGNGFGLGLPPAPDNASAWDYARPLLADPALVPDARTIAFATERYIELLRIRQESAVFGLPTLEEVQHRVSFPPSKPGVIAMHLDAAAPLPGWSAVTVVFNASPDPVWQDVPAIAGTDVALHPVLADSVDPVLRTATVDPVTGVCTVPGRSVAVYVVP